MTCLATFASNRLLCPPDDVSSSILLRSFKYIFLKDRIIYKQKYIEKVRTDKLTKLELEFHIKEFAENLDKLIDTSFIHGDINISNVIFDGLRFNLNQHFIRLKTRK